MTELVKIHTFFEFMCKIYTNEFVELDESVWSMWTRKIIPVILFYQSRIWKTLRKIWENQENLSKVFYMGCESVSINTGRSFKTRWCHGIAVDNKLAVGKVWNFLKILMLRKIQQGLSVDTLKNLMKIVSLMFRKFGRFLSKRVAIL